MTVEVKGGRVVRITQAMIKGCQWRQPYGLLLDVAVDVALKGETFDRSPSSGPTASARNRESQPRCGAAIHGGTRHGSLT